MDFPAFFGFAPVDGDLVATVEAIDPAVDVDVDIGLEFLRGVVSFDFGLQGGVAFDYDLAGIFTEKGEALLKIIGREIAIGLLDGRGELDLLIEEFSDGCAFHHTTGAGGGGIEAECLDEIVESAFEYSLGLVVPPTEKPEQEKGDCAISDDFFHRGSVMMLR